MLGDTVRLSSRTSDRGGTLRVFLPCTDLDWQNWSLAKSTPAFSVDRIQVCFRVRWTAPRSRELQYAAVAVRACLGLETRVPRRKCACVFWPCDALVESKHQIPLWETLEAKMRPVGVEERSVASAAEDFLIPPLNAPGTCRQSLVVGLL